MKDILNLVDPVRISFIEALLKEAGIGYAIQDSHMADLMGQTSGVFPRRLAVAQEDAVRAERILREAGELYDD